MLFTLVLSTLISASVPAKPLHSCDHYLAGVGDQWAELERRYLEIRRDLKTVDVGTPANREINELLGRAFLGLIGGLDRYFADVPVTDVSDVKAEPDREFVHSEALPYALTTNFPSIARMKKLIDEINAARRMGREDGFIYTRPEGGTLTVETPFVDHYLRFWEGRDTDPFVIDDDTWMTVLGADLEKIQIRVCDVPRPSGRPGLHRERV